MRGHVANSQCEDDSRHAYETNGRRSHDLIANRSLLTVDPSSLL